MSSMIATSLPLDSVLDGRLPVSDSSLHCWLDGRQHDSFNEDDSTTSLDESLFASLYDALFEPRPIELMLLCSSHQNLSKSPPPW